MARRSKTQIAQKRTLLITPRFFSDKRNGFNIFYVCSVASHTLLFSTGTRVYAIFCRARLSLFATFVHQRGEQQWRREQRSTRTLRLRPHFCRQAQRFQQFSVALVCHFSLLLCTSAANNNGEARHGENAHFGSERTFVDRHSGFNIFLRTGARANARAHIVGAQPRKTPGPRLAVRGPKTPLLHIKICTGRAQPPEPDFWTPGRAAALDRCQKLQFRLRSARIGADFC